MTRTDFDELKKLLEGGCFAVKKTVGKATSQVQRGFVLRGTVEVVDTIDVARQQLHALYCRSAGGEWIRTSLLQSWHHEDGVIYVVTKNSIYELHQ